ncbi:hypothetical protein [Sphingobacterium hungaricum]
MKKVLISYSDKNMAYSLLRIGRQARALKIFDQIILYTPENLPNYIKSSPLMQHTKGGGYWAWKPAIIQETLDQFEEGTIVVYVDAGCTLKNTPDWEFQFDLLNSKDVLCFQYKDSMMDWQKFGQTSTKIKYWTKRTTLEFFENKLKDKFYGDKFNKIWGGALFFKGKNNLFLKDWLSLTINHPELILDPSIEELKSENDFFAFHKHDQSIITPLANYYEKNVHILEEKAESSVTSNITGSRIRAKSFIDYLKLITKLKVMQAIGMPAYNNFKKMLKP